MVPAIEIWRGLVLDTASKRTRCTPLLRTVLRAVVKPLRRLTASAVDEPPDAAPLATVKPDSAMLYCRLRTRRLSVWAAWRPSAWAFDIRRSTIACTLVGMCVSIVSAYWWSCADHCSSGYDFGVGSTPGAMGRPLGSIVPLPVKIWVSPTWPGQGTEATSPR